MGKKLELAGQKFGKLTVIEELPQRRDGCVVWHCICDCGKECDIIGKYLKSGHTQSCGCLNREITIQRNKEGKGKPNLKNIKIIPKGTRYGKLTVLQLLDERTKDRHTIYQCQCDCGTIINVPSKDLKSGNTQSCGCIKSRGEEKISQILRNNNILFKKEKTFDDCRFEDSNALARFDFYVNNQYIIEYDGVQHFTQEQAGWGIPLEEIQQKDNFKNNYCKENNIPLIRIPYWQLENLCIEDLIPQTSNFIYKKGDD